MAYPASIRVGVLGPVVVMLDGRPHTPPTPVVRALLGALAVGAPTPVSPTRLIDTVWAEKPRDAKAALQLAVHRLRRWLRETTGADVAVLSGPSGYRLQLATGETDLALFRSLANTEGNEQRALDLWRGAALEDVPPDRSDEAVLATLAAERATVGRRRAAMVLAEGGTERALALVRPLCAADPLDEEAHAILVEALAAAGRQATALAEYDRMRRSLAADLGIGPGARLQQAYRKILRPVADEPAPSRWRGPRPHVDLVGRDPDRAAVARLLEQHRLVTLTGPGGVGKTVLALDAAGTAAPRFADGVVVASLVTAADAAGATLILGNLLGVGGARPDEFIAEAERRLANQRVLVVLDNCEHLLAVAAGLAARFVAACPGVTILATSRQSMGVSGEVVYPVLPLPVPRDVPGAAGPTEVPGAAGPTEVPGAAGPTEVPGAAGPTDGSQPAVALFLRRAAEAIPSFRPAPDAITHVAAICRRVDGLPLAIELAAARLRTFPLETLAKQLDTDLGLLSSGVRGDDPRHGALTATIEWSYRLLDADERVLLSRLSVFRGGFTVNAAIAVCDGPPLGASPMTATLVALVERSLVQPYDAADGRRYLLLEAVRELAAQRLAENGGTAAVRDRHLDYWLAFARRLHAWTADYPRWETAARTHAADSANLRVALEHGYDSGRVVDAVELTALAFDFWVHSGQAAENEPWHRKAQPHLSDVPTSVRCLVQFNLAAIEVRRERTTVARRLLARALPGLRRHYPDDADEATMFALSCHVRQLDPVALGLLSPMLAQIARATGASKRVRAMSVAIEVLTAWGRFAEAAELATALAEITEPIATFVDQHRSAATLAVDLCLDRPVRTEAYRPLLDIAGGGPAAPSLGANANLALGLLMLGTGRLEPYRGALLRSVATMTDRDRALRGGVLRPSIYLAEAERRAGRPQAALGRLSRVLGWTMDGGNYLAGFTGVVVAALVAADLGDAEAADAMVGEWDRLRTEAGLAPPVGLAGVVAGRFGVDPAAVGRPAAGYRWRAGQLAALVRTADEWCASRSAAAQ